MTEIEAITEVRFNMSTIGLSDKAAKRVIEARNMSIDALEEIQQYRAIGTVEELRLAKEKQIPKKPILKHDVSVMHINRGNQPHEWKRLESDNWHCPECDSFVGERVYVHSKVHDQRKKKYCDNCGQKLNWESDEE